jgi:hypothetical protein
MVRNSEKKMTRKIRKNRQTRRKRVLKMKTKMRENRMHKTMKGGKIIFITKLRERLKSTGDLGKPINESLNNIAMYIGRKLEINHNFITSYHAAPKLTNPPAPNQGFMNVAPAAVSAQMVQFIPDSFLGVIPDSIEVLILKIMEQYRELCTAFHGISNPCGNHHPKYKLTPDDFDQMLRNVCVGQVHTDLCIRGMDCFWFKHDDKYVKLKDSLYIWSTTSHGTSSQKSPNLDFTVVRKDRIDKVTSIYRNLNTILPNELLNPDGIIYKACIIVMPPFKKSPPVLVGHRMDMVDPITRGYKSFIGGEPLYKWSKLSGEHLAPNMYCENRKNKRTLFGRPEYTMSPLEIPKDLLPPGTWWWESNDGMTFKAFSLEHDAQLEREYQSLALQFEIPEKSWRFDFTTMTQHNTTRGGTSRKIMRSNDFQKPHDDGLDAMVAMVDAITTNLQPENEANLKSEFEKNKKVEMIQVVQGGYYFYYELKIQETTIPLESTTNTTKKITAVIIEFKVFSEDGICSKEIIFVSYKRPEEGSVIPGAIVYNSNQQVSLQTMNSAINNLFDKMFLELERSLYRVTTDQYVLTLKDEDGATSSRRSGPAPPPVPLQSETLVLLTPQEQGVYSGICTIVLSRSIDNTASTLSVAKATPTQQRAFNAVNDYITTTTPEWNFEHGQKTFTVTNRMKDINKIEVIVRILKVNPSKKLISATYQAQDTPQYLLFATPKDATDYINGIMVV